VVGQWASFVLSSERRRRGRLTDSTSTSRSAGGTAAVSAVAAVLFVPYCTSSPASTDCQSQDPDKREKASSVTASSADTAALLQRAFAGAATGESVGRIAFPQYAMLTLNLC